jgi:hypothetical protein
VVAAYRYLRGSRNRPLQPHRQLAPMREMLLQLAEYYRATALQLDGDPRWLDAAVALDAAADALRRVAS